ncbi:hypothetical protein L0990_09590 [Vibrio kanaloae]|uniref:hypothetical protein n=1 Tax=Vibrio kanaloae TaxID=170673 RepID=UPI0035A62B27
MTIRKEQLVSIQKFDTYEKQIVEFDKIIALITHLGHIPSDMELNLNELTK